MKYTLAFLSLILAAPTHASVARIFIKKNNFQVKTQNGVSVKLLELGLKCRVYSKIRILGSPISIEEFETLTMARLDLEKLDGQTTIAKLNENLLLNFNINSLTSYIHACTFFTNVDATFNNEFYSSRGLSISDFTLDGQIHYADIDLQRALNARHLEINKYTNQLNFQ